MRFRTSGGLDLSGEIIGAMKELMSNGELPHEGRSWSELEAILDAARRNNLNPKATLNDRWLNDRDLLIDDEVAKKTFDRFFTKNSANPAVMAFEQEIISMTLSLLNGGSKAVGNVTSGGTESLFIATRAALEWKRKTRSSDGLPELVMPSTGYPAFEKFSSILGYGVTRVPVDADFRANPSAIEAAVTKDTFMIIGSLPPWTHGVCDPVSELGEVALRQGVWLHVDACVGGFLAPFVRKLGYQVPKFDFTVPGVSSISADLHKYGYSPKGASTILFRSADLRGQQHFTFSDWQAGLYRSPVVTGTRAAGPIAGAWAVMLYLGEEGYLRRARQILRAKKAIVSVIENSNELVLYGQPELATLTFGATSIDIFAVSEALGTRGWTVARCKDPDGIQLVLGPLQDSVTTALVSDLEWALRQVQEDKFQRTSDLVVYSDEIS
jgi:sphinganine-1-phosphate aldolase